MARYWKRLRKPVLLLLLAFFPALLIYNGVFLSSQSSKKRFQLSDSYAPRASANGPLARLWSHHHESHSDPSFHDDGGATSMATRIATATRQCTNRINIHGNKTTSRRFPRKVNNCKLYAPSRSSYFCPLAKIASTFWVRLFIILEENSNASSLQSPFSTPLGKADSNRCMNASKKPFKPGKIFRGTFVREPFSRVFSAFVDKLLAPNPYFWVGWGKAAMKLEGADEETIHCGEKVSFRQFFRLINDNLYLHDYHVIPMAVQCDHCTEHFDFIGKMETFSDDLKYFTSQLNVSFKDNVQISQEAKLDAIYDTIQGPFSWKDKLLKCVSSVDMGRRIWRKLQIRGQVSSEIDYPLGQQDLTNMTEAEFYKVAVDASAKSTDKEALKRQKEQALVEAFRTLPLSDIRKYQELFKDDFEIFGYDAYPSFVFDRSSNNFVDTEALNFDIPWRIVE